MNVSRAIRRLGGTSVAMYCCGGTTGQSLRELLDDSGIEQFAYPIAEETRQCVTILEKGTSQQFRFVMQGPTLTETEWRGVLASIGELDPMPELLIASGSLPPGVSLDFYARLARIAREHGSKLILDTSGLPLAHAIREGVFLIKPSLRELEALCGAAIEHEADQVQAARGIIRARHTEAVVLSLGAAGVLLVTSSDCLRMRAPSVLVRSRVGAGDSMVAGLALSLARSLPLREAVRYGLAAGTAAVLNPGTELCHLADVERLLEQMDEVEPAVGDPHLPVSA